MSDLNHPIWTQFASNDANNSIICLECSHYYSSTPRVTTLKNHFIVKHPEIWERIRKNKKNGGYKGKNKQKYIQEQQEEASNSSSVNVESNHENEENFQIENNDINISESIENIEGQIIRKDNSNLNNGFSIVKNIKSIEVVNNKNFEIEIKDNKIKINGKCKIEFK
ncbi:13559_t:CDS:1 [Cetraspora pellucida]|uniref:13559_t:CDS:1 n=1 Tax=Cetraspora pellucida TaxID=1433469 RepID=A0A9N9FV55_9GLOM|nr:13559_t:CDS:1 [Cetraspora pellucida]